MERVTRGHRHAGSLARPLERERHYVTAAISAAVALAGLGTQAYGMSEAQGAGKLSRQQKQDIAGAREFQKDQIALQRMLQPFILESMGLERAENGTLRKRPPTTDEQRAQKIRQLSEERVIKSLEGKLDIDPAATRALNADDRKREEFLARTLGPDFRSSTGGQVALERGLESRRITESAIRRGELTANEAIAQGRITDFEQQRRTDVGLMRGLPEDQGRVGSRMLDSLDSEFALRRAGPYSPDGARAAGIASLGGGLLKGAAAIYGYQGRGAQPGSPTGGGPYYLDTASMPASPGGASMRGGSDFGYGSTVPYYSYAAPQFVPGVSEGE